MKISITIVAYRNYPDIIAAIKSINEFTDPQILKDIYVVDNSENEESPSRKAFKQTLSALGGTYIDSGANIGFGAGHNKVLSLLTSDYHAIVNPDILLYEDSFSALIKFMEENKDVAVAFPKLVSAERKLLPVYRKDPTFSDMFIRRFVPFGFAKRRDAITYADADYEKPFEIDFGQGSFVFIRTELFKKLGGFDERYFMYLEDADLCREARKYGKVVYTPVTGVIHKWERGSKKNLKLLKIHIDSLFKYLKKWA